MSGTETIVGLLLSYKYLLLFPMAFLEGPVVSLIAGIFIYLGYLEFYPAFLLIILGDIIPDNGFYALGKFWGHKDFVKKFLAKSSMVSKNFLVIKDLWINYSWGTMILSKLARGLSAFLMVTAGFTDFSFRNFFYYSTAVTIVKYALIIFIGYMIGESYNPSSSYSSIEFIGIAFSILTILVFLIFSKYARKKLEQKTKIS